MPTVATNLQGDVAASIYIGTNGDNGLTGTPGYGASTVVSINKVSTDESVTTADHSGGQDFMEMHRVTKGTFTVTLEFMYGGVGTTSLTATPLAAARPGNRIKVATVNALVTSLGRTFEGIVTKVAVELASPSTGTLTIMPYGVAPL